MEKETKSKRRYEARDIYGNVLGYFEEEDLTAAMLAAAKKHGVIVHEVKPLHPPGEDDLAG